MTILLMLLFMLITALILRNELRYHSLDLSPAAFLAVPFILMLFLALSVGPLLGFVAVNPMVMVVWSAGIIIFAAGGIAGTTIMQKIMGPGSESATREYTVTKPITKIIRYLSWFFILVLTTSAIKAFFLFQDPGIDAFTISFAGGGLSGHCLTLLKFNLVFHIAVYDKRRFSDLMVILLAVLFLFIYQSKGGVFIPVFAGLMTRLVLKQRRFTIPILLKLLAGAVAGFVIIYLIALRTINTDFLVKHFFFYMTAGVLGLGTHFDLSLPVNIDFSFLVLPIKNVINLVSGSSISPDVSDLFVNVHLEIRKVSNVRSYFGTIYIYGGLIMGFLITFVSGFLLYSMRIFSVYRKRLLELTLFTIFLSALFLGWFDFYFNKLLFYEVTVYAIILLLVEHLLRTKGGNH